MNNNSTGGLTDSSLGHRGTHTRIVSMGSPELSKLRNELKALNPDDKKSIKDITLRELLNRLEEASQSEN